MTDRRAGGTAIAPSGIEIAGLTGIAISFAVAQDLVAALDGYAAEARRRGARLPVRLLEIRRYLAEYSHVRADDSRVDASARVEFEALPHADGGLVDTAAAASELGLNEDTVRWHCRRGQFQHCAVRRAGRWWIPADNVAAESAARQQM